MASDCLFCRIAAKEIPGSLVLEDEDVVAFRDIAPKAPTHVLVVPRKHIASLADAAAEDVPLLGRVLAAAAKIARDASLSDYRLVINTGAEAGQSVFHLHAHLMSGRTFAWPPG